MLGPVRAVDGIGDFDALSVHEEVVGSFDVDGEAGGLGDLDGLAGGLEGEVDIIVIFGDGQVGRSARHFHLAQVLPVRSVIRNKPVVPLDLEGGNAAADGHLLARGIEEPLSVDGPVEDAVVGLDADDRGVALFALGAPFSVADFHGLPVGEGDRESVLVLGDDADRDLILQGLHQGLKGRYVAVEGIHRRLQGGYPVLQVADPVLQGRVVVFLAGARKQGRRKEEEYSFFHIASCISHGTFIRP